MSDRSLIMAALAGSSGSGKSKVNPYSYINQVADYLYEVQYYSDSLDYAYGNQYYRDAENADTAGGCTGAIKGGKVLRHLDWYYEDTVEFVVRTVAAEEKGLHASIGVNTGMKGLTPAVVSSGKYHEKFKLVPLTITDGINDAGIYIQSNVVPNAGYTYDINPLATTECCVTMVARYILDHCTTLAEVENVFNTIHIFGTDAITYGYHFLVAKGNSWEIIELTQNGYTVVDSEDVPYPIMTNFRTTGLTFDTDNKVEWSSIEQYGIGVERYDLATEALAGSTTLADLREDLMYTNTYTLTGTDRWYTEFAGYDNPSSPGTKLKVTDALTNPQPFNTIIDAEYVKYQARTRANDQGTWQTVHSAIYDLTKKSFNIVIQERLDTSYDFALNETVDLSAYRTAAAQDIIDAAKQDTLVSGTNIKTVNGNSVLGSGNIAITTYQPIPLTPYSQTTAEVGKWRTKTMEMFMEDIINDPSAIKGMAYMSTVGTTSGDHDFYNSDMMPTCCELKVEIMQVETSGSGIHKIAKLTATSTNNAPYIWTRDLEGGTSPWQPFYNFPWRAGNGAVSKVSVNSTELSPTVAGLITLPMTNSITSDSTNSQIPGAKAVYDSVSTKQGAAITDEGGYFATDTVEGALQEIGSAISGLEATINTIRGVS